MSDHRLRRDVARVAARMMYLREEREYFTAKRKAAAQLGLRSGTFFRDLPSNAQIREEIDLLARLHEGESRTGNLLAMRLVGLRVLRMLDAFHPRLIGSTLTGHVRTGSDIDIHVFSDSTHAVVEALESHGFSCDVEHKEVVKHGHARTFTHIHVGISNFPVELTLYAQSQRSYVFKSSITGKAIERAGLAQLTELLRRENPTLDLESELAALKAADTDRFEHYHALLAPLQNVKQNPKHHPEGDALYHSLQVFQLALTVRAWDEEFLLAALLHDVGKGIDPHDHVYSGIDALGSSITDRTRFLIEHHMEALALADGTLGHRAAKRLRESPDFDDLMLLREIDSAGRQGGVLVPTIDEALATIRALAESNEWA